MVICGSPENYFDTCAGKVKGLTLAQVSKAAKDALRPKGVAWVVVGDRTFNCHHVESRSRGATR